MLGLLLLMDVAGAQVLEIARRAPTSVQRFVERRTLCEHWAGEEPYDAPRAAAIATATRKLGCARLDADEAALRRRYQKRPDALALLAVRPGEVAQ